MRTARLGTDGVIHDGNGAVATAYLRRSRDTGAALSVPSTRSGAALSRANAELPCTLRGAADVVAENAVIGPSSPLQSVPASIQEIDAAKDENRRAEAAAWSDFYQVKLVDDDSDL